MPNVVRFDRRAEHYLQAKPRALARVMDVEALAQQQHGDLERAHEAFWRNDATAFLHAITRANERRIAIRVITREWSGEIESAEVWTRPDGAVATEAATAA